VLKSSKQNQKKTMKIIVVLLIFAIIMSAMATRINIQNNANGVASVKGVNLKMRIRQAESQASTENPNEGHNHIGANLAVPAQDEEDSTN
jgi:type II secretory pathway pseudopilin PulG